MSHHQVLVVGSVAYDSIETPTRKEADVLGGSAVYFSLAANPMVKADIVAVVGEDFEPRHRALLAEKGIGLEGLETATGKTFRWGGVYDKHLKDRDTLFTHLNVFSTFSPVVPESYAQAPYLFLANIDPDLQHQVLDQCQAPRWVACDTMNFWIHGKHDSLMKLLPRVNALFLNDSEAFDLTGFRNLPAAARWIQDKGPKTVVIKKGEHGAVLFINDEIFSAPALPLQDVMDPTGAGDSFAGGMVGAIASLDDTSPEALRFAAVVGTCTASFCVQDFGPGRLSSMTRTALQERIQQYRNLVSVPTFSL